MKSYVGQLAILMVCSWSNRLNRGVDTSRSSMKIQAGLSDDTVMWPDCCCYFVLPSLEATDVDNPLEMEFIRLLVHVPKIQGQWKENDRCITEEECADDHRRWNGMPKRWRSRPNSVRTSDSIQMIIHTSDPTLCLLCAITVVGSSQYRIRHYDSMHSNATCNARLPTVCAFGGNRRWSQRKPKIPTPSVHNVSIAMMLWRNLILHTTRLFQRRTLLLDGFANLDAVLWTGNWFDQNCILHQCKHTEAWSCQEEHSVSTQCSRLTSSSNVTINPIGKVSWRVRQSTFPVKILIINEMGRTETIARNDRILNDIEKSVLQGVLYNTDFIWLGMKFPPWFRWCSILRCHRGSPETSKSWQVVTLLMTSVAHICTVPFWTK